MTRRTGHAATIVSALVLLATGTACEAATPRDPVAKEIPEAEREVLIAALRRAISAMPAPTPPYGKAPDDSTLEADRRCFWDPGAKRWTAPARATSERLFHLDGADLPSLEYRVYLNHEPELPEDLASAGGAPRQFPLPGTVAVEVTLIGADAGGGRVALPISPEDAATALTVIRIYVGSREMESAVRALLAGGQLAGSIFPAVRKAGEVHSIVVDFYGPKRTVEGLAPALDVAGLRKVLSASQKK